MYNSCNIYLIPGLGGDQRMYTGQLAKFPNTKVLEFVAPLPKETISAYAKRLAAGIELDKEFVLIGVSLGGILAQEIAKIYPPKKVILISTVKSRAELPLWMRFFKYFPLPKIVPGKFYLWAFMLLMWFKTLGSKSNFVLGNLKNMAKDADPEFVYWAANQVVIWQHPIEEFEAYHIHGTRDYLFPIYRIKNVQTVVQKGTHAMILTHVVQINAAIRIALN